MVAEADRGQLWVGLTARRIQISFLVVAVGAGSLGTFLHLSAVTSDVSWARLVVDSMLTGVGFLVLNSGPFPAPAGTSPVAFWLVAVGRASGVVFFSYTAFLGLRALFADRVRLWQLREWPDALPFGSDGKHVVVCGIGEKGFDLGSALLDAGHDVVAVEAAVENPLVSDLRDRGAAVLHGDARRVQTLQQAGIERADEVFVNCGRDETNADVVAAIAECVDEDAQSLPILSGDVVACHVHLGEREWRRFVSEKFGTHDALHVQVYDSADATARELLNTHSIERFDADSYGGRTHVVLVGWNDVVQAVAFHLCQRMHYTDAQDRAITIVATEPAEARESFLGRYPALKVDHWDREWTREFVDEVFPAISFLELPGNSDVLRSERFPLYDRIEARDTLTVVVADNERVPSEATVTSMLPRLTDLSRTHDVDTHVHYFVEASKEGGERTPSVASPVATDEIVVEPFYPFGDACTPATVRGDRRDRTAKRIALFFHLCYDFDPAADSPSPVDAAVARRLPVGDVETAGLPVEDVTTVWEAASEERLDECASLVWHQISESNRESNRFAADHAAVKRRLADVLGTEIDFEAVVERVGAVEHDRWCAERFLDGWEPLPERFAAEWGESDPAEARFRAQKYHLNLRPLPDLERLDEGAKGKDDDLVRFALTALRGNSRP